MEKLTKFSWVFLLLGIMGGVVTLSMLFVGIFTDALSTTTWVVAVGTVALFGFYGYLDIEAVKRGTTSRGFRYSSGSLAIVFFAGAIGALIFKLADDHDKKWDWTSESRFEISEKTKSVVQGIDRKVTIYAFFPGHSPEREPFADLMEFYQQENHEFFEVNLIDPYRAPRMAERFNVTSEYGTVVMEAGEDRQRLEADFEEEAVTDALIRLLSGEDHQICWSVGHGEADLDDDQSPGGFGAVVLKLEDQNYTFTKTNVLSQGIDRSCEALVVARPERDWLPIERERLAVYLAEGGGAVVLLEPETVPELSAEFARYGIDVGHDVVLDFDPGSRLARVDDPSVLFLSPDNFATHAITRPLRATVILWVARSVSGNPMASGLRIHELLTASEESWGETNLEASPNDPDAIRPTPGEDLVGSVPMAVAVEILDPEVLEVGHPPGPELPAPLEFEEELEPGEGDAPADVDAPDEGLDDDTPSLALPGGDLDLLDVSGAVPADYAPKEGGRLVVFGDADFASNQLVAKGNNQDLFVNSLAWMVDEQDQIAAGPQEDGDLLTLNLLQLALIWLISVFLVPGASVGLSALVMLRRRFL